MTAGLSWRAGQSTLEFACETFAAMGGLTLSDTPGGRDELRENVHPQLCVVVDRPNLVSPTAKAEFDVRWELGFKRVR